MTLPVAVLHAQAVVHVQDVGQGRVRSGSPREIGLRVFWLLRLWASDSVSQRAAFCAYALPCSISYRNVLYRTVPYRTVSCCIVLDCTLAQDDVV